MFKTSVVVYTSGMENDLIISRLTCDFNKTIKDPLWKDIHVSAGFWKLFLTPQMQKLDRLRQLGPTALVYPGAVHTRLGHSLGVYHVAKWIVLSLLSNGYGPFSLKGVYSFLAAAMMHDLGHFPYAHSLKEVITEDHEALGARIIGSSEEILRALDEIGADPDWVMAIIDKSLKAGNDEVRMYRNMLSGTLDPDKLDYLCRDAFYCGVPYGVQDVSYLIGQIQLTDTGLGLNQINMSSVEHVLFSKYLMYKNVYWNKRVRCATAMIKRAVCDALEGGYIRQTDLFDLDDSQFIELCRSRQIPLLRLVRRVRDNSLLEQIDEFPWEPGFDSSAMERELGQKLGGMVIVDVPEPISFESDLRIVDLRAPFIDCDPVFNRSSIKGFSTSLRKVRVFAE